jgi:hypothetical protein
MIRELPSQYANNTINSGFPEANLTVDGSVASRSVRREGTGVAVGVRTAVGTRVAVGLATGGVAGVEVGPLVGAGSGVGVAVLEGTG